MAEKIILAFIALAILILVTLKIYEYVSLEKEKTSGKNLNKKEVIRNGKEEKEKNL